MYCKHIIRSRSALVGEVVLLESRKGELVLGPLMGTLSRIIVHQKLHNRDSDMKKTKQGKGHAMRKSRVRTKTFLTSLDLTLRLCTGESTLSAWPSILNGPVPENQLEQHQRSLPGAPKAWEASRRRRVGETGSTTDH